MTFGHGKRLEIYKIKLQVQNKRIDLNGGQKMKVRSKLARHSSCVNKIKLTLTVGGHRHGQEQRDEKVIPHLDRNAFHGFSVAVAEKEI